MGRPLHVDELTGAWEISRWLGVDRKTVYRARFNGMPDPVAIYGEAGGIAVWAWPDIAVWAAAKDYNVEARPAPVGRLVDLDDLASTWSSPIASTCTARPTSTRSPNAIPTFLNRPPGLAATAVTRCT